MSTQFPGLGSLTYWATERESIGRRREAGEPPPWSTDEIFQRERFCHPERERDRVTGWIRENWRDPYRDHPDVWFLLAVARLGGNDPRILAEITPPLPWDGARYLAEMAAKNLKVGVRGYRTVISRVPGVPTHVHLTNRVFNPLWAARERIRPRPGDSCCAFFNRLTTFYGLGGSGFLAGQITTDVKFTRALEASSDWWDFVTPGPGSMRGLNIVRGRAPEAPWSEEHWHVTFAQLRAVAGPQIEAMLGRRLSASDLQSCLCELSKYHRAKTTGRIARPFTPYGEAAAPRPHKIKPAPSSDSAGKASYEVESEASTRDRGNSADFGVEAASTAPIEPPAPPPPYPCSLFAQLAAPFIAPTTENHAGLRVVFDTETNGLEDATVVHCIAIGDVDSDRIDAFGPDEIDTALAHLSRADVLIGHNIAVFDMPLLERLHNWTPKPGCTVVDTLIAARLILPHVGDVDAEITARSGASIGDLHGRYKLEAFGARLGLPKTGIDIIDFSKWTPELQARCVNDTRLTKELWRFLQPDGQSRQALELEHRVAAICDRITADGIPFDRAAAERLREQWQARRDELETQLRQQFPKTKNLNSRLQIGKLLEARDWVFEKRTEKTGAPHIDDELLERLPTILPEFAGLAEYHVLGRRLGQLADGPQAWLNNIGDDGRIHGGLIHIGTPHGRAKHLKPNMAQVPSPKRGKPFATECRGLFRVDGWVFVACDQANLQDRAVGHYLHDFDGGAYTKAFVDGVDMHWQSAIALGLIPPGTQRDKANAVQTVIREGSKSFRYGFLFGAGAKRAGEIIAEIVRSVARLDPTNELCRRRFDGGEARQRFMAATPGLRELRQSLEHQHDQRGWIAGLDGRRVPTGARYKSLNRAVTAVEAIICKTWLVQVSEELHERFRYGWEGDVVLVAWVHDELACACRPEIAEQIAELLIRHAKAAGEYYGLKVPLDAEFKIGADWAGTPLDSAAAPSVTPAATEVDTAAAVVISAGSPWDDPLDDLFNADAGDHDSRGGEAGDDRAGDGQVGDDQVGDDPGSGAARSKPARSPGTGFALAPDVLDAVLGAGGDDHDHRGDGNRADDHGAGERHSAKGNSYDRQADGKVPCPFHKDDTPSLQLYGGDDPHYHCFGCGAHGPLSDLSEELLASAASSHAQIDDAETLAYAHRLWEQAKPIAGTLAERYLAEIRGIDVGALPPDIDKTLRFHAHCPFNGERHPCLLALFRDVETDAPAGIHRIGLTPTAQKIDRHMLGRWPRSRAIKLWPAASRLYLGEGIETALAAATRILFRGSPMRPVWAAGSSGSVEKFPVIFGVDELILLVDRGAAGETAAAACCRTWQAAGRRVRRLRTQDASLNDFNDLVRARLATAA